ncbi:Murein DD-endopeptidase MepM and murein hydrolase activator NlpD, contain LysM domain [Fibrobacter sp. UWR3]|uniref:peptidoglycan DD-metalloendopeptidase family protein n=1 Tax=Fibrobacter sp. UWR3 TaxID=1896217 RepID=UPI0009124D99|nr:peptidoglycan DD-metalloendopeptidase family protein [Fibrobacter sp. UWR3]SHN03562.1 Murein DD-endopeptidase MepM and murein hydrolase activator NlpD, contain LysM domain [Fibrobacter sp. UWR3]
MKFFYPLLCAFLVFFSACHEEEKLAALRKDVAALENSVDSLQKAKEKLQNVPNYTILSDTVRAGEGPFHVFSRLKAMVEGGDADLGKVYLAMQDSVEFKLRVGEKFYIAVDADRHVQRFRYAPNVITSHVVVRTDSGFVYKLIEKPVVRKLSVYEGALEEGSTLNGILLKVGIPRRMVGVVSGVLQCKVAFPLARASDRFRILLEDSYFQDSIWVSGKVVYAEFEGRNVGHHEAFRYEDPDPKSSYNAHYTESGDALVFDGLRYPLEHLRITSSYGSRVHPITGRVTVHYGVDYGAPTGTVVHAVAEGEVTVSGFDNLSGNKIAIRHRDGTTSWYMHLSARGVGVGAKVSPGQAIGRVGSTGRSTGPHLHYGFKNAQGQWINPLSKTMIATPKLSGERLARLKEQVKDIRKEIDLTLAAPAVKVNDSTDVMVRTRVLN